MLRKYIFMTALAAATAGVGLGAQTPSQSPSTMPETQRPQTQTQPATTPSAQAADSQSSETTITGCVYREQDVAGRTPNVAEKAGVLEDYILAEMTSTTGAPSATPSTTPGATGTSGTANRMFKLEKADDEKLSDMVGKRVQVTGRIDREAGDATTAPSSAANAPDRSAGPDKIDLAEFEVSSIQAVAGTCPASPSR